MPNFLRTVNFPYVDNYEDGREITPDERGLLANQPYVFSKRGPYTLVRINDGGDLPQEVASIIDSEIALGDISTLFAIYVNSWYDGSGKSTINALFIVYLQAGTNKEFAIFIEP